MLKQGEFKVGDGAMFSLFSLYDTGELFEPHWLYAQRELAEYEPLIFEENEPERFEISFVSRDLKGASFKGASLEAADFSKARLEGANFEHALLKMADFVDADLTGSNLGHADLAFADLTRAAFFNADLRHAELNQTIFSFADLTGANFEGAHLTRSLFTGANLCGANFRDCDVEGATFESAIYDSKTILPFSIGEASQRGLTQVTALSSARP